MRGLNLTEPCIEFVFGQVNNQLRSELKAFWEQNNKSYQEELKSFRSVFSKNRKSMGLPQKAISRQPAAISRDQSGLIDVDSTLHV